MLQMLVLTDIFTHIERAHKNKETQMNIRTHVMQGRGNSHDLQLYVMVLHKHTTGKGMYLVLQAQSDLIRSGPIDLIKAYSAADLAKLAETDS